MLSLVIVNYRSAALAIEAIRSARANTSTPLRIVVVDNSCDPTEAASLMPHADVVVAAETNRGYAAGINAGRPHCDGDVMIVSNPDVTFDHGCLDVLASSVTGNVAAAGPALFWDRAFEWMLPPADLHTAGEKIDEVLASRSAAYMRWRDRRRFRARLEVWSARKPVRVRAISGAVMAISTKAFDEADGFDERFTLYFEETDFLRRLVEMRKRILYVPQARCRHLYDQSASQERLRAETLYAESELRYLEKWNAPWLASTLKSFERPMPARDADPGTGPLRVDPTIHVVEISPHPAFMVAAGYFPHTAEVDVPADAWATYRGNALYLRAVNRRTGEVERVAVRYKD